jgi:ATP-dependent DNA ligase
MKYVKIEGGKKLSSFITPMMAQLTDLPAFDSPEWIFEIKWDGYRGYIPAMALRSTRLIPKSTTH